MKILLLGLAFTGLLMAGARSKSYSLTVTEKLMVGSAQLKPGQYHMKVEASNAVFFDNEQRQVAKAPVTVATVARKFDNTEILSSRMANNSEKLDAIELQGTKLKVEFKK